MMALGGDSEANKHVLAFVTESSQSLEVLRELMRRMVKRGFACSHRVDVALDGSDALRGAVKECFSDFVLQRCLVHK